jgi:hypothetical protein
MASACPAGTFGAVAELSTPACSGQCWAGYFCPSSSTSASQIPCGGVDLYCPVGSAWPQVSPAGDYTVGPTERTRNSSVPCPSGSFCIGGVMAPCLAGSFGCSRRLSTPTCNGPCTAGFYCPSGSLSSQAVACGGNSSLPDAATHYCPQGAALPSVVAVGFYSVGSPVDAPHLRTGQLVCPLGFYCTGGIAVRANRCVCHVLSRLC